MRFIYVCNECQSVIGEIELQNWDETMLGFDALTWGEKQELVSIDPIQQTGTVKAICDACYRERSRTLCFYHEVENSIIQ